MMITPARTALSSLALLGLALALAACPATLDDRCAEGACDPRTSSEGGPDVIGTDGGADAPIDPCIENPSDAKCLDESTSLFVSNPKGNDQDASGTRDKPFKTLGAALAKITPSKRRIYVCEGIYPEDVTLTAAHSSVSIFGGVDCAWAAAPAAKPVFGASANPLKITGTAGLAIADIAVVAKDATDGSSIAAFANGGAVTLKRVRLAAGKGAKGASGVLVPFAFPDLADLKGQETTTNTGALEKSFLCPGGAANVTVGGKGGDIGFAGVAGTPGATDNKGALAACGVGGSATDGAVGKAGPAGMAGARLGELTAGGWVPKPGLPGDTGTPGQGGGGGGGAGGGGGGGGAGGCGGAGGGGGKGGGASIGLASLGASVVVSQSSISAEDGGDGGNGVSGQPGQPVGGAKGNGTGCPGGVGGGGGIGGAGAGGAAGTSAAIAYKGTKPTIDPTTAADLKVKNPGKAGTGGAGNDASPGIAEAMLELN